MTWTTFHHRGEVLRAVTQTADARRDGVLPMDVTGVRETFGDELTLLGALQLRWHTRLSGHLERALLDHPTDLEQAAIDGLARDGRRPAGHPAGARSLPGRAARRRDGRRARDLGRQGAGPDGRDGRPRRRSHRGHRRRRARARGARTAHPSADPDTPGTAPAARPDQGARRGLTTTRRAAAHGRPGPGTLPPDRGRRSSSGGALRRACWSHVGDPGGDAAAGLARAPRPQLRRHRGPAPRRRRGRRDGRGPQPPVAGAGGLGARRLGRHRGRAGGAVPRRAGLARGRAGRGARARPRRGARWAPPGHRPARASSTSTAR